LEVIDMRGKLPVHATKNFASRDPAKLLGMTGHHSAGPNGGPEKFEAVAKYHIKANHVSSSGCPGILYTAGIPDGGEVCIFHDLEVATWSQGYRDRAGDENEEFLAILVLGSFTSPHHSGSEPTLEQLHSFTTVLMVCKDIWGPAFDFTGHFQFGKPACPGGTLESIIKAAATHVAGIFDTMLEIQTVLKKLGYAPGPLDGLSGPMTRSALCSFQKDQGLGVTGETDPKTKAALAQALSEV
tara:strand:+ start:971 stop:1693 length:723 start_codon:yes stop_codon:yes gene_type:complete